MAMLLPLTLGAGAASSSRGRRGCEGDRGLGALSGSCLRRIPTATSTGAGALGGAVVAAASGLLACSRAGAGRRAGRRHRRRQRLARTTCCSGAQTLQDLPRVLLGHDGSEEAARWLQALQARGLLTPSVELLSPPGRPSETPSAAAAAAAGGGGLGRVFAVLPDGRLFCRMESNDLALDPPCIGTDDEWETWDYIVTLLGEEWRNYYAWEYWRFLQPPSRARAEGVAGSLHALAGAVQAGAPGRWWREPAGADAAAAMLAQHGFCVLEDFLPHSLAQALASSAQAAWRSGNMASGVLGSGSGFARGDSVLWINTEDPALKAGRDDQGRQIMPKDGQMSAAVPQLGDALAHIDAFVAEVVAPRAPEAQGIATRSHAMFTCYPGAGGTSQTEKGYLRHLDNDITFRADRSNGRVLTTILYLNEGWEVSHGGALRLYERSPALQVRGEVLPKLNQLVAFWAAEVPHEVLAPKGRDRFACTFWYLDKEPGPSAVAFEAAPARRSWRTSPATAVTAPSGGASAVSAGMDFLD